VQPEAAASRPMPATAWADDERKLGPRSAARCARGSGMVASSSVGVAEQYDHA